MRSFATMGHTVRLAQFLAGHPKVRRVHYPSLESHSQRALAMEQMHGGGGVLSFEVHGSGEDARRFSEALHLFTLAPSLGAVDSLVSTPVLTSHAMILAERRRLMGVSEQMVRLSVGIENVEDLIADLEQALRVVRGAREHARGTLVLFPPQRKIPGLGTGD